MRVNLLRSGRNEQVQDLFGWGRIGANYNYLTGPVRFFVRADDFERATALLETLDEENPPKVDEEELEP